MDYTKGRAFASLSDVGLALKLSDEARDTYSPCREPGSCNTNRARR